MNKMYVKYNCRDHMSDLSLFTTVISRVYVTEEVLLLDENNILDKTLKDYGFVDDKTIKALYEDKKMCDYVYRELIEVSDSPIYEVYIVYCNNEDSMNGIGSYIYACRRDNTWEKYPFPYCILIFDEYAISKNNLITEILTGIADSELNDNCKGSLYNVFNKDFDEASEVLGTIIDHNVMEE